MKLIIDISEEAYRARQHWVTNPKRMLNEVDKAIANGIPLGECRTCKHRDPEDKKCDCGGMERQFNFPVSDNYFCKYYEKGSTE